MISNHYYYLKQYYDLNNFLNFMAAYFFLIFEILVIQFLRNYFINFDYFVINDFHLLDLF
jgi:hypothetical protein